MVKRTALNRKVVRRRFAPRVYAEILERQKLICACGCGEALTDPADVHYDHELPLWCGGEDAPANLRALKRKHHLAKTRSEAAALAKTRRIVANGSHRKRNPNATEKEIGRILSMGET